jgi:putative transposase
MAIALRSPPKGCIFHSDRGSQYGSHDDQKIRRENGFKASISGQANCHYNAAVLRRENSPLDCFLILLTFFKTIKAELIWRRAWETRRQAETAFGHSFGPMAGMPSLQYINGFYNPRRRHSALGGKIPLAFERQVA